MAAEGLHRAAGGIPRAKGQRANTGLGREASVWPPSTLPSAGHGLPDQLPGSRMGVREQSGCPVRSCSQDTAAERRGSTRTVPLLGRAWAMQNPVCRPTTVCSGQDLSPPFLGKPEFRSL